MHVRPAIPADIPAMIGIVDGSATAAHWSREHYERLFGEQTPRRVALVVEDAAALQGFLVAHAVAGEWEIENIAVAGAARRRGLGTRLLEEFLKMASGEGATAVFSRCGNRIARRGFFTKNGRFVESGRRSGYYAQPQEDAIVYRLSFT